MRRRLAIVVSHPVQYLVPLYRRLAAREDLSLKVFYTWHGGDAEFYDPGFKRFVRWDVPLTTDYDYEVVQNVSSDPGTHHFFGLNNPTLVEQVVAWSPDVVHITGWAWLSHLAALRDFYKRGLKTLFRGDSHLLGQRFSGPSWWLKRAVLKRVYRWPSAFPYVGSANRVYYECFGVEEKRLFYCPHSIEVNRFADPTGELECRSIKWRQELGISIDAPVVLFAGKFESNKRPLELMRAFLRGASDRAILVMVGNGKLEPQIMSIATAHPRRIRVLPFQNQSRMPLVYRLGDLCVLASGNETWGLAVNEALASSRPVLVSNRVGCARDIVDDSCGQVFNAFNETSLSNRFVELTKNRGTLIEMRIAAQRRGGAFDISATEDTLIRGLDRLFIP